MKKRSTILTVILSIIMPGLGHIYNGRRNSGILVALTFLIFYTFILSTGVFVTFNGMLVTTIIYFIAYIFVIVHSVILARKNSEYQLKSFNKLVIYFAAAIVFHVISYFIGTTAIFETSRLASESMNPTLQEGDYIMCLLDRPELTAGNRGQMIIFKSPYDDEVKLIKRAIAFGGETIEIRSDSIFIDGNLYQDQFSVTGNLSSQSIHENEVFVLGDNRINSEDSRHYGPIDVKKVIGRPLYIYWSSDFDRIGKTLE